MFVKSEGDFGTLPSLDLPPRDFLILTSLPLFSFFSSILSKEEVAEALPICREPGTGTAKLEGPEFS